MSRDYVFTVMVLAVNIVVATLMYNFVCWHFFRGYNEVSNMIVVPSVGIMVVFNLFLAAFVWWYRRSRKRTGFDPITAAYLLAAVCIALSPLFAPELGRYANRQLWIKTPLVEAARYRDAPVVIALLKHGADPNVRERASGRTPLHYMAYYGETEAVKQLLKARADPNVEAYGETPLDWAIRGFPSQATVEALVDHGAARGHGRPMN